MFKQKLSLIPEICGMCLKSKQVCVVQHQQHLQQHQEKQQRQEKDKCNREDNPKRII